MVIERRETTDRKLEAAVNRAVLSFEPLRMCRHSMSVQVNDGRVRLTGAVRTTTMKLVAEELARRVPGVQEVQNDLVSDSELQLQVAQRLAADPRTRLLTDVVTVRSFLGTVHLGGQVDSGTRREAAAKVAGEVKGVRQVLDELQLEERTTP
jgi:osmotically-inducible protein OsmY